MNKYPITCKRQTIIHATWRGITAWVLVLMGWLFCSTASAGTLQGTATYSERIDLPASYEGELPGAGSPIAWHVDLLPEGRYQLRRTYIGRPEPHRFDDIGRWTQESGTGRIILRGGREAPIFLMPVADGAALRKLDLEGKPIESSHNDRLARLALGCTD